MTRKLILALAIMAVPVTMVAAASTATAARPASAVTFTGKISCSVTGKITSKPGLMLATPQTVTITLTTTLTKCTGHTSQGGATITGGSAKGTIKGSFSCESLVSSPPDPSGTVTWKTTGNSAAPTKFKLSDGTSSTGPPLSVSYKSTQTGSFKGTGKVSAVIKQTLTQLETACESTNGLTTINLKSGKIS